MKLKKKTVMHLMLKKPSKIPPGYWKSKSVQRAALEQFGREKLGVKELDDWYSVKTNDLMHNLSFIRTHYGTLHKALEKLYPQHEWNPLRFHRTPQRYWNDESHQKQALEALGKTLGVKELDDWYGVSARRVYKELKFVHQYKSLFEVLKKFYPQHDWDPLYFHRVPQGYWSNVESHRHALESFGRELFGVKELDDWYKVAATDVQRGLKGFVSQYGSLFEALKKLYPEHNWDPLRFSVVPRGYWRDLNAQRDALERIGKKYGVKELDDWYSVPSAKIYKELSFLTKYGSLFKALKTLYPQHEWRPMLPRMDMDSQRNALEKLGREKLGVKELDDWYHVSARYLRRELGFLGKYNTLYDALKTLYPQHSWDPLRFTSLPRGYWQRPDTAEYYHNLFTKWKHEFQIRSISDWHQLPPQYVEQFKRVSNGIFGSKIKLLQEWFPDIVWRWQLTSQVELKNLLSHVIADANLKHRRFSEQRDMQQVSLQHMDNRWNNTLSQILLTSNLCR